MFTRKITQKTCVARYVCYFCFTVNFRDVAFDLDLFKNGFRTIAVPFVDIYQHFESELSEASITDPRAKI